MEYILVSIAILIFIFFAIREIVLWYFRINVGIKLLENIDRRLAILNERIENGQSAPLP